MPPTIGQRLRLTREAKNLSLDDVHRGTKIHAKILSSLEEDKFSEILNPIYIRSFLKRYSHYLGLSSDQILKEYAALNSSSAEQAASIDRKRPPAETKINLKSAASIFAAILFASAFAWFLVTVKPAKYLKAVKIKRQAAPPKNARIDEAAQAKERPLIVPKNTPLKLTVKASDNSWMHIKSDGKIVFQGVLQKGSKETWEANDKIELWTGNASALDLTLNGRPLGSPGKGVIKNILVTREGITKN